MDGLTTTSRNRPCSARSIERTCEWDHLGVGSVKERTGLAGIRIEAEARPAARITHRAE